MDFDLGMRLLTFLALGLGAFGVFFLVALWDISREAEPQDYTGEEFRQ